MSSFDKCRAVEARAMARLLPFMEEHAESGQYVVTDKGVLAPYLQEVVGDVIMRRKGAIWGIEIKAEEKEMPNLFLEVWSNRNLNDPHSYAERGSNTGWLYKTRSDLIFYYFLDTDTLYILNTLALKRWAFGWRGPKGETFVPRIFEHPERAQSKHAQLNDTHGRCVPIKTLMGQMTIPPKKLSVRQLQLDMEFT